MEHANVIKHHHQSLRNKLDNGQCEYEIWKDMLKDGDSLKKYSEAMHNLATSEWSKKTDQNRITWCSSKCHKYFHGDGFEVLSRKIYKKSLFDKLNPSNSQELKVLEEINVAMNLYVPKWKYIFENKLLLLDVGSCYSPFSSDEQFTVYAIDIAPATDQVYNVDFLNATFYKPSNHHLLHIDIIDSKLKSKQLIEGVFDIVVFSLFLSYFPSPKQRLICCLKANKCLKKLGMLLIVTPDSSHQNRHTAMMKSWKSALEGLGFRRWKYEKLEHLHCMVYIKVDDLKDEDTLLKQFENHFYIAQDKKSSSHAV